jgi:hypothetical protein
MGAGLRAPSWFVTFFSVFFILSVVGPLFFYIARPYAAARLARKYPVRHVSLISEAVEVSIEDHKTVVAWARVKHVWTAGDYLLLVLSKLGNISIPCKSLPPGAAEFIHASAKASA